MMYCIHLKVIRLFETECFQNLLLRVLAACQSYDNTHPHKSLATTLTLGVTTCTDRHQVVNIMNSEVHTTPKTTKLLRCQHLGWYTVASRLHSFAKDFAEWPIPLHYWLLHRWLKA